MIVQKKWWRDILSEIKLIVIICSYYSDDLDLQMNPLVLQTPDTPRITIIYCASLTEE